MTLEFPAGDHAATGIQAHPNQIRLDHDDSLVSLGLIRRGRLAGRLLRLYRGDGTVFYGRGWRNIGSASRRTGRLGRRLLHCFGGRQESQLLQQQVIAEDHCQGQDEKNNDALFHHRFLTPCLRVSPIKGSYPPRMKRMTSQ